MQNNNESGGFIWKRISCRQNNNVCCSKDIKEIKSSVCKEIKNSILILIKDNLSDAVKQFSQPLASMLKHCPKPMLTL